MTLRLKIVLTLLAALAWSAVTSAATGVPYQINPPAPNSTLRVCVYVVGDSNPCATPAAIYSDLALTVPIANPITLSSSGNLLFFAAAGNYTVQLSGQTNVQLVVGLGNGASSGGGTCPGGASGDIQFSNGTNCTNAAGILAGAVAKLNGTNGSMSFTTTANLSFTATNSNSTVNFGSGTGGTNINSTGNVAFSAGATESNTLSIGDTGFSASVSGASFNMAGGTAAIVTTSGFAEQTNSVLGLEDLGAGVTVGSPTGGGEGAGTLNATGLFVNGVAVGTGSGTVTSVATTAPITGGPITTTGTIACATCVVATSPGVGIAHFAGSTQTVTSSAVNLAGADVTGQLPITAVGSAGLSGTSPIAISAAGAISCSTCNTSAATVTSVSFTGGLISVATPTTTPALTVAGTSGGIPYFSSASTWATSAALTANTLVKGGGAGAAPSNSSITDNGTQVATSENILISGTGYLSFNGNVIIGNSGNGIFSLESSGFNPLSRLSFSADSASSPALCVSGTGLIVGQGGAQCTTLTAFKAGSYSLTNLVSSNTAPTILATGCGGTVASISANNGTAAFNINVGTAPTSGGCTVTMPAATTGWNCQANDQTTQSTSVFVQKQTGAISTTSVILQNFSDVAVATAPTASDIYHVICAAY